MNGTNTILIETEKFVIIFQIDLNRNLENRFVQIAWNRISIYSTQFECGKEHNLLYLTVF